jgi:ketosteroid isomerase-like protein
MNAKDTMTRYFETWNAHDFDAFEAQLADEITFAGPLGTANGPAECRRGIEGLSSIVSRAEVITWFELQRDGESPVPVANWARVRDGKIVRVRVTFDPRPLLG